MPSCIFLLNPISILRDSDHYSCLNPITVPERLGAVLLIGASLVIGLYPRLLLDWIVPSFDSPLFEGLRKVGLM